MKYLLRNTRAGRQMAALAALLLIMMCGASLAWAAEPLVLRGARIHPVSGPVIERGVVVIGANGQIAAVGAEGSVKTPGGAAEVDVSGKVITPGLFDPHTSLGLVEVAAVEELRDTVSGAALVNAGHRAGESFNVHSAVIAVQRPGGVTDALIVPTGGVVMGQSAHVELSGEGMAQGRVAREGVAQHIQVGSRAARAVGGSRGTLANALRDLFADVAFYLKNARLFDENRSRALSASPRALTALQTPLAGRQPVVFAASKASDIQWLLTLSREYGLRPIISGGQEAWMVADELARAKVPVILNAMDNLPATIEAVGARQDNAALLHRAGVRVMLSTFESHNVRKLRQVAGNAVRAGLPHDVALAAVTLNVAQSFGLDATHGSIAPGKVANLVVWSGDPFELSSRVESMYIRGEPVSLDHRQNKLYERYKKLERRAQPLPPTGARTP